MALNLLPFSLDRMVCAVEKVRERLIRAVAVLEAKQIPYAVIGGNAVAAWVSRVDEEAVRNTADVDMLLRRADLPAAITAMAEAGFVHAEVLGVDMFLDGPQGNPRSAVHILFAGEKVRDGDVEAAPDIAQSEENPEPRFRVISLEALVKMKLNAFRRKDQVHLLDFLELGLVDATWLPRLPVEFANRLQSLIDTPNG